MGEVAARARNSELIWTPALARAKRNDHIARPGVVGPLQAFVRRQRLGQTYPRRLGELGGGLLAEEPEQVGGAFQVTARRRVRGGNKPDRKT
jgi:hypothetical protein